MIEFLVNAVIIISIFSAFVYICAVKKKSLLINLFGSYLVFGAIFEIIAAISAGTPMNMTLFHIYNISAFLLIASFFLSLFQRSNYWFVLILACASIYIVNVYLQTDKENNFYIKNVLDIVIILMCLFSFFYLILNSDTEKSFNNLKFFIFGIFVNFSGSFLIFLFFEALADISDDSLRNIYTIRVFLNLLAQILFVIGLLLSPKSNFFEKWVKSS